jgi:integrase
MKITKRTVDAAAPGDKVYVLWDEALKGFGIRVQPSGVKTYFVMYRPDGGGRGAQAVRFTIGRHGAFAPDQAREAAEAALRTVAVGHDPHANKLRERAELTVDQLCDRYMADGTGTKKPSTLRSDLARINCHIKPLLGGLKVSKVTGADVERFMRDVAKGKTAAKIDGKRKRTDSMSRGGKGTAARTVGFLGGIFSYAVKLKLRSDNPVHGVERYKDRKSQRFLDADELGQLGLALEAHERHGQGVNVIRLLALTGARKGEIEGLRWSEIDAAASCLRLADSKTGQKIVPLGAAALAVLLGIDRYGTSPFVFPARDVKAGGPDRHFLGTPKIWRAVTAAAGLEGVRLHDLRHTFASLGVGGGHSLPMIGKILGHADVKTTAQYAHLADDPVKQAVDRISSAAAAALTAKSADVIPLKGKTA